jgi:inner membrane protein
MSPITHALVGWVIAQPLVEKRDRFLVTAAAIMPDIDGMTFLAGVDTYQKYHHTFGHNIFTGIIFSAICLLMAKNKSQIFFICFISFHSHLVFDLLGSGADWGIYYLWPLSSYELKSAPPFQWELDSWQNLMTTFLFIVAIFIIGVKKGRTILELISSRLDSVVVTVFKKWAIKSGN